MSHRHGRAWQDSLHFLLGHNMPVVSSCPVEQQPSASPADVFIAYKRSPGARGLLVAVELHEPAAEGHACTVEASIVGHTPTPVHLPGGALDGTQQLRAQAGLWSDAAQFVDVLNVSELTVGALSWLRIRWTNTIGTTHGVSHVHAIEVPRRSIAEDSDDAGVDASWPFTGNFLWDGSASTTDGFVRLLNEIDRARTEWRTYTQSATVEASADAWACGSSVGVFAPVTFGRSAQPKFPSRARRLYSASTHNQKQFVCRYTTGSATDGAELELTAQSYVTGTVSTATVVLPASLGWSASSPASHSWPCDGTDQEVILSMRYKTTGAANLKLSHWGWMDNES